MFGRQIRHGKAFASQHMGGIMNDKDLRSENRIKAADLPDKYATFTVLLPEGLEEEVHTTDASLSGFGFVSSLPPNYYLKGTRIVLYPLGRQKALYGQIIHSSPEESGTRVGIHLQDLGAYETYRGILSALLSMT